MATYDLVILSSSPPAASPRNAKLHAPPASSPQRVRMAAFSARSPSPPEKEIITSTGALKPGSRAAPFPNGATRGFATAASLLKSHHFDLELDYEFADVQKAQSGENTTEALETIKKPRKRAIKAAATDKGGEPALNSNKARARKLKADVADSGDGASTRDIATAPSKSLSEPPKTSAEPKPKKPRARKTAKVDTGATTTDSSYSARATNSKTIPPPGEPEAELRALPQPRPTKPRKPRTTKANKPDTTDSDVLAETTNITKAKPAAKARAKAQKKSTGAISTHFVSENPGGEEQNSQTRQIQDTYAVLDDSIWDVPASPPKKRTALRNLTPVDQNLPLQLDGAVPRRQGWTPTKDTRGGEAAFTSPSGFDNAARNAQGTGAFTSLLSGFTSAYVQPQTAADSRATPEGPGLATMKKRPVELIDVTGNGSGPRDASPEKTKAPKKKARTVTDHVLAQYAPVQPHHVESSAAGDFFGSRTATTKIPLKDADDGSSTKAPSKPTRKRASSKQSAKSDSTKSKKASAKTKLVADKLLSPTTAIMKMNKQDVLFGTSSQLTLEESPTYVRHMQQAIRESEQDFKSFPYDEDSTSESRIMQRLGKVKGKRQLWAASARDEHGMLLEDEGDVYIPEPDRTQDIPLLMDGTVDEMLKSDEFADIDDLMVISPAKQKRASDIAYTAQTRTALDAPVQDSRKTESQEVTHGLDQMSFTDINEYNLPPPSNQQQAESSSFLDIDDFSSLPLATATSNTQPSTSISIPSALLPAATAISLGSPTKKPSRPPKSQSAIPKPYLHHVASRSQTPNLSPPSTPAKSQRYANVDEILDSEDDEALSPTPPRPSRPLATSQLPLAPSQSAKPSKSPSKSPTKKNATDANALPVTMIPASHLSWETIKPTVFARITSHIRSLPPSTSLHEQTWHEKILQYIPIPLEDFTSYLNSHTAIRTWKKATQVQIKAWRKKCKADGEDEAMAGADESGEEGEEMVAAVEKEIEVAMVQAWCQEMSVCCFVRDLRKGGVRKGLY